MTIKQQAADILERAGLVLSLPEWWTQGDYARNKAGHPIFEKDQAACKFCALGAVLAQEREADADAFFLAWHHLHQFKETIPWFNDTPGRTNTEVASLLLDAADALRKS